MENTDKVLIYDDDCPLCTAYTSAFVKSGLLSREGRQSFTTASPNLLQTINWQRSKNEIPLLDTTTHQVWHRRLIGNIRTKMRSYKKHRPA